MSTRQATATAVTDLTAPQCEKEHARWLEEIAVWKRDHARALRTLIETADFIHRHDDELDEHLQEIETHREHQQTGADPTAAVREKHLEVRRRHNVFQGRHRALIDEVMRLRVQLHKAAHGKIFP